MFMTKSMYLTENTPLVKGNQHLIWKVSACHRVFKQHVLHRNTNMGAITSKELGAVPTPWINLLPEVNLEGRHPTKYPSQECVVAHEVGSSLVGGDIHPGNVLAESSEGHFGKDDQIQEIPANFITSPCLPSVEEDALLSSFPHWQDLASSFKTSP